MKGIDLIKHRKVISTIETIIPYLDIEWE